MRAGRLMKNPFCMVICLAFTLLLAGCAGNNSTGSYAGATYTVKRGDTLYRISRITGTSVKELASMNGI